jgi:hypothetical protein
VTKEDIEKSQKILVAFFGGGTVFLLFSTISGGKKSLYGDITSVGFKIRPIIT